MEIGPQKALTLTHFSHAHPLHLSQMNDNAQKENPRCGGCHEECSPKYGVYACRSCTYFLHSDCADLPREIRHPADELHPLALLAVPPYPVEIFSCSACCQIGRGFLFRLDVHPRCARPPACVQHPSHKHALVLATKTACGGLGFICDLCVRHGRKQWYYRCKPCGFELHTECALKEKSKVFTEEFGEFIFLIRACFLSYEYSFLIA